MKHQEFETKMRKGEWFHSLRIPEGVWTIIRVDGRGFSKLTQDYKKPFDDGFHAAMVKVATRLVEELSPVYCHTHSDEISIAFPPELDLFDREVEKLVSTSAGLASASFTANTAKFGTFDSRIWIGATLEDAIDYFSWRQADAYRNCIQSYCYWMLRDKGLSQRKATSEMRNKSTSWLNETLFQSGTNINDVTPWHRRGTGLYKVMYRKQGFNPLTEETVFTTRKKIQICEDLFYGQSYRAFVEDLLPTGFLVSWGATARALNSTG